MPVGQVQAAYTAVAGSGDASTSQAGTTDEQNGCAIYPDGGPAGTGEGIVRLFPGAQRVQLPSGSNPTVAQIGPQEYKVVLSLSGTNTVQLTPGMANSQQVPSSAVSPNTFIYSYTSRQKFVATVDSSGLVTAQGRGECVILVGAVRAVNASIPGSAEPPTGNTGNEVYCELIVTVLA